MNEHKNKTSPANAGYQSVNVSSVGDNCKWDWVSSSNCQNSDGIPDDYLQYSPHDLSTQLFHSDTSSSEHVIELAGLINSSKKMPSGVSRANSLKQEYIKLDDANSSKSFLRQYSETGRSEGTENTDLSSLDCSAGTTFAPVL